MGQGKDWVTVYEAAALLGVSVSSVYRWLHAGKLPGEQVGAREWRVRRSDLPSVPNAKPARVSGPRALGRGGGIAARVHGRRGARPRLGPCPSEEPEPGSEALFDQRHNEGLAPSKALRKLLEKAYGPTGCSMKRRDVLAAFGYRRRGARAVKEIAVCLAERGVLVSGSLEDGGLDDPVTLRRDRAHFDPGRLAEGLTRELGLLAAGRARMAYRDLLLYCGCTRDGDSGRDVVRKVLLAGHLVVSPPLGAAKSGDAVYVRASGSAAHETEPRREPACPPVTVGRKEAEGFADAWLEHRGLEWRSDQQRELTVRFIEGRDTFGVLPTGSGKSLCFQLASQCLEEDGLTLVVSPLLALIADQTKGEEPGVTFLNSTVPGDDRQHRRQNLWEGRYRLLYVTPEQLGSESLLRVLTEGRKRVVRVVIDEAHCVSEWGHSFRVEYLLLRDALLRLGRPPVLLLTATAPPDVRNDVVKQLGVTLEVDRDVVLDHYRRDELDVAVAHVRGARAKYRRLREFIREQGPRARGIIYTRFATAGENDDERENCDEIAQWLSSEDLGEVAVYHGRLGVESKAEEQRRFTDDEAQIIVATNAFGLGIDLPRIDWVVHFYMPPSLLDYYQEIGRGGRAMDAKAGERCRCLVLYDPQDRALVEQLVWGSVASADKISQRFRQLILGRNGQHGLRGPHEVLYDDARKVLLLPFRPMQTQYTVRIGHMLALQEIGVLKRRSENLFRGGNVYAQFDVAREELTAEDEAQLYERQERRRQTVLSRLDGMQCFCEADCAEARWGMLDEVFGR
ncbi:MAG TPA: RecQ family ATP-dependent DNA helicase [Armatimonadota bacterium]|nr:RecQ family ATP-dependent DNA helicase [Armatimonadota bacterium]